LEGMARRNMSVSVPFGATPDLRRVNRIDIGLTYMT
jgi:hypothetical protein